MARALSQKVGRGKCPACGELVGFRRSSGGKITFRCDACDLSGFMEEGGAAHRKIVASIVGDLQKEEPTTKLAPVAKAAFSLGNL